MLLIVCERGILGTAVGQAEMSLRDVIVDPFNPRSLSSGLHVRQPTRRTALGLILGAPLGACSGVQQSLNQFSNGSGQQQEPMVAGNGQVKVALILPLSAAGNAGLAAQSMKNSAEMALAEFQNPNIQLLIKDDAGTPQGSQQSA